MSFFRSCTRSRNAHSTRAISASPIVANVLSWSVVSMTTSCAPMPVIRSNIPSPSRSSVPSTRSAGNLFGTTRRSQPGAFGPLPFCRYARTSGGVMPSCPGQNGQCSRPITSARCMMKSFGRFCRSVETTTQRSVTGSFLSSGIEGVLQDLDLRRPRVEMNRHDVEAAGALVDLVLRQILRGQAYEPALLHRRHRFGRGSEFMAGSRFDLDEHQRVAVARDDVDLAGGHPIPAGDDGVAACFKGFARQILSGDAQA